MFNIYIELEKGKMIDVEQIDSIVKVSDTSTRITLKCGKTIDIDYSVEEIKADINFYLGTKI